MNIGIIGAGNVGAALGRRLSESGHAVRFGVRDPEKIAELVAAIDGASAAAQAEVAAASDAVFLTVPGPVAVDVAAGLGELDGVIVVDCANPLRWDNGPVWNPPPEGSIAAAIAARCPKARVVKAFNTFGAEFHADPKLGEHAADVYMAGDDADAKAAVAEIAESAGFAPVDAGPLRNAAVLENLAMLWIHLALAGGQGRDFAFKMLRR
jgi:NADPH-dependent F420 reductase